MMTLLLVQELASISPLEDNVGGKQHPNMENDANTHHHC
jgi:hypothetical protein